MGLPIIQGISDTMNDIIYELREVNDNLKAIVDCLNRICDIEDRGVM